MKTTIPKLRRMIRKVIEESWDPNYSYSKWGGGTDQTGREPELGQTLEAIEIIEAHGGNYNTSIYKTGEEYSDEHREVIVGRAGDVVFMVTVTPGSFSAQIHEGEKEHTQSELPGQKGKVNPNDYFAQGKNYQCNDIEEFDEVLAQAAEDYARPMISRARRSGARKAGYEHFRNR
jgi:hypothetical protein